jgi:uncharacterized radical SAM superfamily Fe-S cluster-containing enzyme
MINLLREQNLPLDYAVHIQTLTNNDKDIEKIKAIKFLIAGGYVKYVFYDQKFNSILITQTGLDAYNSVYFLQKEEDEWSKKKNNTISALSAIVVAAGVLWSILQPIPNKQDINIQIQKEGQTKPIADTNVVVDRKNDSITLIYKEKDSLP